MFDFLKCLVVKTKYDECETHDKSIQCDLLVEKSSVAMHDKYSQCDTNDDTNNITPITQTTRLGRKVFLRERALHNIPFELYEENGDKFIIIKEECVFLRHIKGHFKYDEPWTFK